MPNRDDRFRWKRELKRWLRPAQLAAFLALLIAIVLAVFPAVSLVVGAIFGDAFGAGVSRSANASMIAAPDAPSGAFALLVRSMGWALAASCTATSLVWGAARIARRERDSAPRTIAMASIFVPLILPPWLLFAAMWLSVGPGTWIGDLAERMDEVPLVRMSALFVATTVWAMAPAFGALLLLGSQRQARSDALLALDGAGTWTRIRAALARDARGIAAAIVLPTVFLLSETTVYDLALVPTYGFEVRAREALGARPSELLLVAWPVMLAALACVVFALRLVATDRARALRERDAAQRAEFSRVGTALLAAAALPALFLTALFVAALRTTPRPGDFLRLHGTSAGASLTTAAIAALIVALFAVALRLALDSRRSEPTRRLFRLALVAAGSTCFIALVPGTVLAAALESAYNHAFTAWIYDGPAILVFVLAARASIVAVLIAFASHLCEPESAGRLRALDGDGVRGVWRTHRHALAAIAGTAFIVGFGWSLGELTASGRLAPPGMPWLATDMLNAIHYQRPETVLLGAIALVGVAWFGAFLVTRAVRAITVRNLTRGASIWVFVLLTAGVALPACSERDGTGTLPATNLAGEPDPPGFDRDAPVVRRPLEVIRALEGVGRGKGQFNGPRALATDVVTGDIYVIDKDARVQRFARDGTHICEWRMPKKDRGKPVGATVAPDGSLVVADTHEHRIVAYSPEGEIRWMLGEYGREHGQFIYPTDIVFAPDGRMFIAEYGGNDRIQVFDRDRRFLYAFGTSGSGPVEFLRPQAMALDAERDELYIVDAGNHRVQVVTTDGEFRREIGGTGREAGKLAYPFGIVLLIDGVPVTSQTVTSQTLAAAAETSAAEVRAAGVTESAAANSAVASSAEDEHPREIVVVEHSNHRVQRLDARTGEVRGVAGGIGRESGRLKYPWALDAIGVGPDGRALLALCDQGNSRIVVFPLP
jgi:ABC-type Fe3+ transport system permease subunit/DNA-binding beta-propeller fold protein YncE